MNNLLKNIYPFLSKNILLILLVSFSLNACKQAELPEEIIGDPTFYLEGDVDGEKIVTMEIERTKMIGN